MSSRTLHRVRAQDGFTLLELLVVTLIIAILATIALATFLGQRSDGQDAEAKAAARTARIAVEVQHQQTGSYAATAAQLQAIEPALVNARNIQVTGTATTYTVSVDSDSGAKGGGTFTIERDATGKVTRTCVNPGRGGCKSAADASGSLW